MQPYLVATATATNGRMSTSSAVQGQHTAHDDGAANDVRWRRSWEPPIEIFRWSMHGITSASCTCMPLGVVYYFTLIWLDALARCLCRYTVVNHVHGTPICILHTYFFFFFFLPGHTPFLYAHILYTTTYNILHTTYYILKKLYLHEKDILHTLFLKRIYIYTHTPILFVNKNFYVKICKYTPYYSIVCCTHNNSKTNIRTRYYFFGTHTRKRVLILHTPAWC